VARELIDDRPLKEVTIEETARQAGVSAGLVFHYFGTGQGFRRAVAEKIAGELLERVAPDPGHSHMDQLHSALDGIAEYVEGHPSVFLAVSRLSRGGSTQDLGDTYAGVLGTLAEWIRSALTDASVPATPALNAAVGGWLAFVEEVLFGWVTEGQMTRTEVVTLCESVFYHVVQVVVVDPAKWERIAQALAATPNSVAP
jgi:AcrR family transcriptional regulator